MVQGGVEMVQNVARRAVMVQNGEKEGWKWCRMGQGRATVV